MTGDLLTRARAFLVQCGSCDFGVMEYGCNCPPGDPRSVIADLVREIERLRVTSTVDVSRETEAQQGDTR